MPAPFDEIWIHAAELLGMPVNRGGDGYVHYDGAILHISTDEHLDADDTIGQLIFHEMCHALVQGPANRSSADWGLDNTSDRDEERELAAIRLQAHLGGAFGLRQVLFPTTVWRAYYEALGDDALAGEDTPAQVARIAARCATERPWVQVLDEALTSTARVLGLPLHPKSGYPMHPGDRRCGDCGFRAESGLCKKAQRRAFAKPDDQACCRWEAVPDCLACGACCRHAYEVVEVSPREKIVTLHPHYVIRRDKRLEVLRDGERCAALSGAEGGPYHCVIYDDRPRTCRDYTRASHNCLDARRRVGLSL